MKNPPKSFKKYASAPELDGIKRQISNFYCGEEKEMRQKDENHFSLHSLKDGRELSLIVLQTTRGFYLGHYIS